MIIVAQNDCYDWIMLAGVARVLDLNPRHSIVFTADILGDIPIEPDGCDVIFISGHGAAGFFGEMPAITAAGGDGLNVLVARLGARVLLPANSIQILVCESALAGETGSLVDGVRVGLDQFNQEDIGGIDIIGYRGSCIEYPFENDGDVIVVREDEDVIRYDRIASELQERLIETVHVAQEQIPAGVGDYGEGPHVAVSLAEEHINRTVAGHPGELFRNAAAYRALATQVRQITEPFFNEFRERLAEEDCIKTEESVQTIHFGPMIPAEIVGEDDLGPEAPAVAAPVGRGYGAETTYDRVRSMMNNVSSCCRGAEAEEEEYGRLDGVDDDDDPGPSCSIL